MSFQLPQFPNLLSLRKQAKALHRKMGQGKLADAQHTLAQEYGFATWAQLKSHVESLQRTPAEALRAAVCACDANRVCRLLKTHLELQSTIDAPLPNYGFGQHALFAAVQRTDRATIEVLLAAGADIDALDVDHESTPAQYMLRVQQKRHYPRDRQDVARHLIARGCNTPEEVKLELACELGDEAVFQRLLALNADAARTLAEREPEKLPNSAQDNNTRAVRLMLQAGWMVDTPMP
jgi:hypothetical protein